MPRSLIYHSLLELTLVSVSPFVPGVGAELAGQGVLALSTTCCFSLAERQNFLAVGACHCYPLLFFFFSYYYYKI